MKQFTIFAFLFLNLLAACNPLPDENDVDKEIIPANSGSLEFRFILPAYKIPKDNIHRISLNFAYTVDSLYSGQFFRKVNVSDFQEVYNLVLLPDDYYFDAVITCSCGGDTCLNGGFPGGRFGMKHTFDKFSIVIQKNTVIETHFQ